MMFVSALKCDIPLCSSYVALLFAQWLSAVQQTGTPAALVCTAMLLVASCPLQYLQQRDY
jgi:hypothetical protein